MAGRLMAQLNAAAVSRKKMLPGKNRSSSPQLPLSPSMYFSKKILLMNPSVATNVKRKFNVTTVVAQYLLIRGEKNIYSNNNEQKSLKKRYFYYVLQVC